jgi:hypothetical protein
MCGLHVAAGVGARPAGGGTDLLDQLGFQVGDVRVREKAIDALVLRDIANELVDNGDNSGLAALAVHRGSFASSAPAPGWRQRGRS